jgi:hypothetical protein
MGVTALPADRLGIAGMKIIVKKGVIVITTYGIPALVPTINYACAVG